MQNCSPAAARICNECAALQTGGVRAVIFVKKDVYISDDNYFNELFWLKLDYQGKAFFVHKARGSYDPEPVLVDGFGTDGQIVVGVNNTLTYEEPFDVLNLDFYNSVANSSEYRVLFVTGGDIRDGGTAANISAISAVGAIDTQNVFAVTVTWRTSGIIKSHAGTPPLILTDCAYFEQQKERYCPPPSPVCTSNIAIVAGYGNGTYPTIPGQFTLDYTFEDVACYPVVFMQQTQPSQHFFDTFDVVENGVIVGSADPARLGITGIFSMADLVAATPLSVGNYSQWAMKFDPSLSYRVSTWYNNGIGGGEGIFKTVKIYVRGFGLFGINAFCPTNPFEIPSPAVPYDPKNVYVVSEATRICLCPKLTVAPLTSAFLLDGSPAPAFLQLDPNTIYEYSLTGNFIDADYQRKICCGTPSVMFVFIGSSTVVLNASNVGPVTVDGVTFTYDPLTYTVTVETPADVTGINFTAVANIVNCETNNYSFGFGDCGSVIVTIQPESNTDIAGYLTANPSVNAVISVTAGGTGVAYLSGFNYEWTQPQTDTMTITANVVAPNDRYPTDGCCQEYDPDFVSGSLVEFNVTSPCGGGVLLSQSSPSATLQNYDLQWQLSGGAVELVITNLLDPLENDCDLTVHIQCVICGAAPGVDVNVSMVNSCSNNIDFIEPFQGPAAVYLAANPGVDAVVEYEALHQLIYIGTNQYTWNSYKNNAFLKCNLTQQPGNPLLCCADYASVIAGETGSFTINSPCLSAPVTVDFANAVAIDSGFTFFYIAGAGSFGLVMVNNNAPTQAGPCTFSITSGIEFCIDQSTTNAGPVITIT